MTLEILTKKNEIIRCSQCSTRLNQTSWKANFKIGPICKPCYLTATKDNIKLWNRTREDLENETIKNKADRDQKTQI